MDPFASMPAALEELLSEILTRPPRAGERLRAQGLDSMAATRLWLELRARFGVEVALEWLAAEADPAQLTDRVRAAAEERTEEQTDRDGGDSGDGALQVIAAPDARALPFALTPVQESYVLGAQAELTGDPVGCDQYLELAIAALDVQRLRQAWQRVAAHHDMLRVELTDDGRQRIGERADDFPLPVHDLRGRTPSQLDKEVRARRDAMIRRRDLEAATRPPFALEVSLGDEVSRVHVCIDQLVTDGHGLALLLRDWRACYDDPGHELPAPEQTARDCAVALAGQAQSGRATADLAWWAETLRELPPGPALGGEQARDRGPRTDDDPPSRWRRHALTGELPASGWRRLRRRAEALGVSPSAMLLSLFARALGKVTRQDDLSLVTTTTTRAALPAAAAQLVGPFTSTAIVVARQVRGPLTDSATALQRQLWDALAHGTVSGIRALRHLRSAHRDRPAPELPVVFTSLLGVGPGGRQDLGFAADQIFALCRTSGVALEHQLWERGEALCYRWDVAPERFAPGVLEAMFAAFHNALAEYDLEEELDTEGHLAREPNQLQQAYYVARASEPEVPWNGCQIYQSFALGAARHFDLAVLERSAASLIRRHEALRTALTADGRLEVHAATPRRWAIPAFELSEAAEAKLADELAGRAFPLGSWPPLELCVTHRDGAATLHCAFDLAVLDAKSIHLLCRRLLAGDPGEAAAPAPEPVPADEAAWDAHLAQLPPGPALTRGDDHRRGRLSTTLFGWAALSARATAHRVAPDALLLAAFLDVLARRLAPSDDQRFAVPVVSFPDAAERYRPGEHTQLGWVARRSGGTLEERAAAYQRALASAPGAEGTFGLRALRRRVLRQRGGGGDFAFPVVYTSLVDLDAHPLPTGVAAGRWQSVTPEVSLDCIGVREGDAIFLAWDAVMADFPDGQLAAMFDEYRRLVAELAGAGAAAAAVDREQILYGWNDTRRPFPAERLAHQLFEIRAAERPDAVALRGRTWTRTFSELNRRANQLAWFLKAQGGAAERVIAVALPRGPEMIAACLAITKAGGAYLPVEPSLPAARAFAILEEAAAELLLTQRGATDWPPPPRTRAIALDELILDGPVTDPPPASSAGNLAYVIFTSGSTGKPKGVAVAHRAVANLLAWCHRSYAFGPGDLGLAVTPLGFDLSVFDLFGVLGAGGALYVADEEERADPQLLLDILLRERITFWNSAPTALALLAPLLAEVRGRPGAEALRLIFLSGDYTPLSLPPQLAATFPRAKLVSLGGATEATVWSNSFSVTTVDPSWRSIPYGRPIDNSRYHVLDADGQPCPPDVEGDLYIGGECLALGYYRRPELTAERFVPDPFSRVGGQRLYRTGDRASYFPDGELRFLGRSDRQLKIRGFRVELEEIEHHLRQHPDVADVAAAVRLEPSGEQKLVAYAIAADPEKPPSAAALRELAARSLPDYMVPNAVALLAAFPATANGKLDRDALPWPLPTASPAAGATETAGTDDDDDDDDTAHRLAVLEEEVTALFAKLLGAPRFSAGADIWDQGATSFTVVQISNALRQRYGRRVPVSAVVAEPTAHGIARWLAAELAGAATSASRTTSSPARAPAASASRTTPTTPAPPPPVAPPAPDDEPVDYFSAEAQRRFKERALGRRPRSDDERRLPLPPPAVAAPHYQWRASCRQLLDEPVPHHALASLLSLLAAAPVGDRSRRLYPSAGETYAVQVYLHLRERRVDGVAPGLYYYDPIEHALVALDATPGGAGLDRTLHSPVNRPVYDTAAFELFLIGQRRGIEPLYREQAERFLALEAGHLAQLLMLGQAASGLGLCPIGDLAFERLRRPLGLDDGHRFLLAMLGGRAAHPAATAGAAPPFAAPISAAPISAANRAPASREIAITGLAGRYPGAADVDALWRLLATGSSALSAPPPTRPELGASADRRAGFLERIDQLDSLLFRISPAEARLLDPQLRLLLETVWSCLDDAGHSAASLSRAAGKVGVVVAAMWQDYQQLGAEAWQRGGRSEISAAASDIAHRISQSFDFQGPSLAVDAACTSSLAAIHLAASLLERGECGAVVVGAVNLFAHPYHLGVLEGLGLSAQPLGGAFSADGSGFIPGEGVAAILLRPVADALADGDVVHGVLEATWLGHAGRLPAADPDGLARSIADMLERHRISPRDVSYVECAAAGASLADAGELEALARVFASPHGDRPPLLAGTLKPQLGHLEAAAGLSQLTKVLLQLRHQEIAATSLATSRNPLIAWDDLPLRFAEELTPWPASETAPPRRALVSSLGALGAYAHLVVRAAPPRAPAIAFAREHLLVLSAASRPQLVAQARRIRAYLAGAPAPLADVAYTLQTGRAELGHRLAIPCADVSAALRHLDAFLAGKPPSYLLSAAATAWLRGEPGQWSWPVPARRVSLPAYPFQAAAHWLERENPNPDPSPNPNATRAVEDRLITLFADASGIAAQQLDPLAPLEQYGLSSLLVTPLNARLEQTFGETSRTLFYEHPSLRAVAAHLAERRAAPPPTSHRPPPAEPAAIAERDLAIIGLAGCYPLADDLDELWRNLAAGRDCITPLPPARRQPGWPVELMEGGYLRDVDQFDAAFFGFTAREADLTDPQERLLLEAVWQALDDAGYPRHRLRRRHRARAGVWIGAMYNEYPFLGVERALAGEPVSAGAGLADLANRVSYFLDLCGPSMTVDTLCSSSLTALHLAAQSLRLGECELAIVGGVNLSLHPNKFLEQARHHMPASDHRCRSFGAGGDGFVPGEGVGVAIVKPLSAALADGDRVHAVLKATAVNHGGKSNGYMVPTPAAQAQVVRMALDASALDPSSISYIEAHGTGTALGDPIELAGLERAFAGATPPPGRWRIGSVKSAIGHLEGAAGLASLTKVLLQLRHRQLVPSLHAGELNPNIDWERVPFAVQRELAEWPAIADETGRPGPRRASISSFGAGGANAHVIVEEAPAEASRSPAIEGAAVHLIVLSALDEPSLRRVAAALAAALAAPPAQVSPGLAEIAYTLQVGREPLRERLAFPVADLPSLHLALARVAAGETLEDLGACRGRAATSGPLLDDENDLGALARAWTRGAEVEWSRLYPERPRLASLPSYPFARRRHWVPWQEPGDAEMTPLPPRYRKGWSPAPLLAPAHEPVTPTGKGGRILCVFHDASELAAGELVRLLGDRVFLVREGDPLPSEATDPASPFVGLVELCDLHRDPAAPRSALARLEILRRFLASHRGAQRLVHVTSPPSTADAWSFPRDAALVAGLVRALGAERRSLAATTLEIDVAEHLPAEGARAIAEEFLRGDGVPEVSLRDGRRHLPSLRAASTSPGPARLRLDPRHVYLVTGGTRGLGAEIARLLVARGARTLAILGAPLPPAAPDPAAPLVRELEARGNEILLWRSELTDRSALTAFLDSLRRRGPLGGVVHCAGRTSALRRPFTTHDLSQWQPVLAPKVFGLELLAELCASDRPAFFVLFSSIAGAFPALAAGATDYAAANASLDAFAEARARAGQPWFRSIAWPSWRGAGAGDPEPPAYARLGLGGLSLDDGLQLFEQIATAPEGGASWICPGLDEAAATALLSATSLVTSPAVASPPPVIAAPVVTPAPVPPWLTAMVAELVGAPAHSLLPDVPFGELGLESILLTELLHQLEAHLGRPVEPTLLVAHPTLATLAAQLAVSAPPPPTVRSPDITVRSADAALPSSPALLSPSLGPIAVIGAACRFPGAPDVEAFWALLRDARCAVAEVPASRWSQGRLYRPQHEPGKSISKWGGFLDDLEDFDPAYFHMTDDEARCADPAVRLVLEGVETCLADAGYTAAELAGRDVGVFAGARASDYWRRAGARTGNAGFGGDQNFIAARVAQHLDLGGPCFVIDSACSSSLVAVQAAARSLLAGESDLAFAAGVDVLLDERPYLEFSAARALSPSGRCRVFDERADGFVPGEGCGVLLLKRLDRAVADGDRIRAVLDAVAVNNDGRTVGLTTPSPAAQTKVILRALTAAGRRPEDLAMIEAHGTGTTLGDPIELRALTAAFAGAPRASCAVGSVKSNLGHLLSAAGLAGLLKAVLSVEHALIPPSLFCDRPNPRFDFERSPFYPSARLAPWPADRPLRAAGVSAFGLGGTNAHAIVTAFDPRAAHAAAYRPSRQPRAAPLFHRRRLWLPRPDELVEVPAPLAPPPSLPASASSLPSSLLHFEFLARG